MFKKKRKFRAAKKTGFKSVQMNSIFLSKKFIRYKRLLRRLTAIHLDRCVCDSLILTGLFFFIHFFCVWKTKYWILCEFFFLFWFWFSFLFHRLVVIVVVIMNRSRKLSSWQAFIAKCCILYFQSDQCDKSYTFIYVAFLTIAQSLLWSLIWLFFFCSLFYF